MLFRKSFAISIFSFVMLIMLSLLSSCERDLSLDSFRDRNTEDMLVVNAILNPDSVMKVSVTHPFFFSVPHTYYPPVDGLEVMMSSDVNDWQSLEFDPASGLYVSDRRPTAGTPIRLRITGKNHEVSAIDTVPHEVIIEKVEVSGEGPIHIYWDDDYRFTYRITFQDPPEEENFYFLSVESDALSYEFSQMGQVDYSLDYVFNVLAEMINKDMQGWRPDGVFGYPFSDKGIDGKRYTLTITEVVQSPMTQMIERLPRRINLYSISRPYFEYMLSILSQDYDQVALKGNLLSLGLIEPTKIYTNIESGAGLLGCYTLNRIKIDLLKYTGGWPSSKSSNYRQ